MRSAGRFAAVLASLAFTACSTVSTTPAGKLEGTAWRAASIDGKPALAGEQQSTLRFFDRQLAGGSLGCNAYTTTYFTDAGLRFGAIAATRKACEPKVMEQETRFSAVLEETRAVRTDGTSLLLIDAEGRMRAKLAPLK